MFSPIRLGQYYWPRRRDTRYWSNFSTVFNGGSFEKKIQPQSWRGQLKRTPRNSVGHLATGRELSKGANKGGWKTNIYSRFGWSKYYVTIDSAILSESVSFFDCSRISVPPKFNQFYISWSSTATWSSSLYSWGLRLVIRTKAAHSNIPIYNMPPKPEGVRSTDSGPRARGTRI